VRLGAMPDVDDVGIAPVLRLGAMPDVDDVGIAPVVRLGAMPDVDDVGIAPVLRLVWIAPVRSDLVTSGPVLRVIVGAGRVTDVLRRG